ncbi:phosphoglycerate mutase-like protein 4 isoform X1 [Rhododendron vialii]|uniref:phosphoglycerate mutase-like protein 4 isoform X1 n=1 Tax=Rhododendron vialii TaxID=182163 RepID=UPI00265F06A8|nr:phosphoglycerate mutase-like protein 4 isoform X1 [Rhododendron vialii]
MEESHSRILPQFEPNGECLSRSDDESAYAEIIVIRHGETEWNAAKRMQGHLDIELNDVGRKQAAAVAHRLSKGPKIAVVYSSDLKRALDTAETIASSCGGLQEAMVLLRRCEFLSNWGFLEDERETNDEVIKDLDLRERHLGDLQGLVYHEASKICPKAYGALSSHRTNQQIPGGGESLDQLYDRCTSALERIGSKHIGERVVVVTHGGVIKSLFERASPSGQAGRVLNTSVNIFHLSEGDIWTIKLWGDVSHLNQTEYLTSAFGGDGTSG